MCQLRTPRLKSLKTHPELLNSHSKGEACHLPVTEERIKANIVLSPRTRTLVSEPFSNQGTMGGQFLASSDFILGMLLAFPSFQLDSCESLSLNGAVKSALLGLMCHVAGALLGGDAGNIFETGAERTLSFLAPLPSQLTTCGQHQCFSTSMLLARKGAPGKEATDHWPLLSSPRNRTHSILSLGKCLLLLASLSQRPPHSVYALMHCQA